MRDFAKKLYRLDGRMARDQTELLISSGGLKDLTVALLLPRLGELFPGYGVFHPDVVHLTISQHPQWCDDPATIEIETCDNQVTRSFERAVAKLRAESEGSPGFARWGGAHKAVYSHQVWSKLPVLADFLTYRISANGGSGTINNAMASFETTGRRSKASLVPH